MGPGLDCGLWTGEGLPKTIEGGGQETLFLAGDILYSGFLVHFRSIYHSHAESAWKGCAVQIIWLGKRIDQ